MPSHAAPHAVRLVASRQRWHAVTFLHWAYPPAVVQALLPSGLEVDVVDGDAWVAVTPLLVRDVRASVLPAVPGWSEFAEVNVRTYVRHPASGTDGIWFLRLLCPRTAMVGAMRALGLAYRVYPVTARRTGSSVVYCGDQAPYGRIDLTVRPGDRIAAPSPWLTAVTGRWNAYTVRCGRLWRVPVAHPPWPLHRAQVTGADRLGALLTAAGLPAPTTRPVATWSPGVDTRVGVPRPLPGRRGAARPG
ncbi:YqjF family protein [Isoptericola sp. NPDC055881]